MPVNISKQWHKSFNFSLIGCGRIGHCYATVLNDHPEMKLASVVDINPEAARAFGNSFRCFSYNSLDELLAAGNLPDCAIICTPPSNHAEIACRLMENGIHILCETPFALDSFSAEKMFAVSGAYGVSLMMGAKFRFVSDIIQAKGLIEAGILGHVLEFEGDFRDVVTINDRWHMIPEISGGGVLIDSGAPVIDAVHYLFGPLYSIRAEESRRVKSKTVEDTVCLEVMSESGVMGTVHLSWVLKNSGEDYFRIYGTHGNMSIGWKRSMYRPLCAGDWIHFSEGYSTQKALKLQLRHFINVITGKEAPEISTHETLETVRVVETAYQSLQSGKNMILNSRASSVERNLSVINSDNNSFPTWVFNR
ncbi:MAG TPA: Gfo/Idh/MocA family oxidoreductase [Acidobacteriota bacterium]|nr:Gfo/Idh/MocA family oxidoreductase [Acidobacteriota bacterium]